LFQLEGSIFQRVGATTE